MAVVGHLHEYSRIFGKEGERQIAIAEVGKVDFEAALRIGEAHFQQSRNHTSRRNVVASQKQALIDAFLHSGKGIAEIFGVGHVRHVAAHVAHVLSQRRTSQTEFVHGEVDVVDGASALHVLLNHGTYDASDVAYLATRTNDDRSRRNHLAAIGIFLCHGERVLARWHVHADTYTKFAQCFDGGIQTCVFALLGAAGPHPVGGEAHAVQPFGQGSPDEVREALGNGQLRASRGIGQSGLRCVTQGGGNTCVAAIVKGHDAAVGQRQLQFALRLLVGHLARYGAVHLVGQPVLAGYGFKAQHAAHIVFALTVVVGQVAIVALHGFVYHNGFGRVAEHLRHIQIEGALSVSLLEGKVGIARRFAHHV